MGERIIIEVRSNYGREAIYPANDQAARLALIAGTKTLSREVLKLAIGLGHTIEATTPEFVL